jgi:hypothetical protein
MKDIPKGIEITDAITKHMDRRFLSSLDLAGQGQVALTIERVEKHAKLDYLNGNSEENAIVLYFAETPRPLTLKPTNIAAIIDAVGSNKVSDWKGKRIMLEARKVLAFGKQSLAVRVIGAAKK